MSGAALRYDLSAAERIRQKVERIAGLDRRKLLDVIGAEVEGQVRRRIESEKAGPDGVPWPLWSERYRATRHGGHSLLEGAGYGGGLLGSIDHQVDEDSVEVGTSLLYGATHQFGDDDRNIPARPYLGLSGGNEDDLLAVVEDWLDRVVLQ